MASTVDALLTEVDVVIIATMHDALTPLALQAMAAGKHVLVEKPAGRTLAELEALIAAQAQYNAIVKVGYNHRFHPALQRARAIVDSGVLGELLYIRASYGHGGRVGYDKEWRADAALSGGGELIDQGSHLIDLAHWFLGPLEPAFAHLPTYFWDMKVEDNAFLALRSMPQQGVQQNAAKKNAGNVGAQAANAPKMAWLHASWTEWKNQFRFELFGRDGKLLIEGLGGSYGTERLTHYQMLPEMGPPNITVTEFTAPDDSWALEFAEFTAAIREGRQPVGNLADALATMRIIEGAYRL